MVGTDGHIWGSFPVRSGPLALRGLWPLHIFRSFPLLREYLWRQSTVVVRHGLKDQTDLVSKSVSQS